MELNIKIHSHFNPKNHERMIKLDRFEYKITRNDMTCYNLFLVHQFTKITLLQQHK